MVNFTSFQPGSRRCWRARGSRDDVRFCRGSQPPICIPLSWRLHSQGVVRLWGAALPFWVRPGGVQFLICVGSWWKKKTESQSQVKSNRGTQLECNQLVFIPPDSVDDMNFLKSVRGGVLSIRNMSPMKQSCVCTMFLLVAEQHYLRLHDSHRSTSSQV